MKLISLNFVKGILGTIDLTATSKTQHGLNIIHICQMMGAEFAQNNKISIRAIKKSYTILFLMPENKNHIPLIQMLHLQPKC